MSDKNYRKYLYRYGILSLLFVLEYLIKKEKYRECQKIIDTIKEESEYLKCKLPTRREDLKLKDVTTIYRKLGLTGTDHYERSKYYSETIISELRL